MSIHRLETRGRYSAKSNHLTSLDHPDAQPRLHDRDLPVSPSMLGVAAKPSLSGATSGLPNVPVNSTVTLPDVETLSTPDNRASGLSGSQKIPVVSIGSASLTDHHSHVIRIRRDPLSRTCFDSPSCGSPPGYQIILSTDRQKSLSSPARMIVVVHPHLHQQRSRDRRWDVRSHDCVSRQCVSLHSHPAYQDRAVGWLSGTGMNSIPLSAKELTGPPAPPILVRVPATGLMGKCRQTGSQVVGLPRGPLTRRDAGDVLNGCDTAHV